MLTPRIVTFVLAVPAGLALGAVAALVECDWAYRRAQSAAQIPSTHARGAAYGVPLLSVSERLELAATLGRAAAPRPSRGGAS